MDNEFVEKIVANKIFIDAVENTVDKKLETLKTEIKAEIKAEILGLEIRINGRFDKLDKRINTIEKKLLISNPPINDKRYEYENVNDDMVNLGKLTPSSNKKPKNSINKITNIDKKIKRNLTGINDYINVQKDLKIPFNIQLDKKNTKIVKRHEGTLLINNNNCIDNDLFINKKENSY